MGAKGRLGPAALLGKFRGPGTAEKRPADLDDAAYVARAELAELTLDQALPTLEDAGNGHALVERAARDGAYRRIHAGGIATTRQDRDLLHQSDIIDVSRGCPQRLGGCSEAGPAEDGGKDRFRSILRPGSAPNIHR